MSEHKNGWINQRQNPERAGYSKRQRGRSRCFVFIWYIPVQRRQPLEVLPWRNICCDFFRSRLDGLADGHDSLLAVFFSVDSHATWRAIRWFNAPQLRLIQVLPIRASAYILSLVNEQVGKGAMSLYLAKRHEVPGWQALSTMVMLGLMEIYQLLFFSGIGVLIYYELVQEASTQIRLDVILPAVFAGAVCYLPIHILFFRGVFGEFPKIRNAQIFRAFREARPIQYLLLLLFKAPNLIGAVLVYTFALQLFNVDVGFGQMLAFLPVIFLAAALPLPFHAGALLLWTVLFPGFQRWESSGPDHAHVLCLV